MSLLVIRVKEYRTILSRNTKRQEKGYLHITRWYKSKEVQYSLEARQEKMDIYMMSLIVIRVKEYNTYWKHSRKSKGIPT